MRGWQALALTWCGLGAAARAQAPEPAVRTYVVQPGDSVWSIAAEFYGAGDKYPIIYRYNDFAAEPPFLLKPGQSLRLPILGEGPAAEIAWLLRDVRAKPPRALDWLEARERMNLWRLYRVATGDKSAARILFEDQSDLKLRENALLVIYGASASAARTARRDKTEVVLEQGTILGGLAALDEGVPAKPLVVRTPSGQVDLLAKLAQVQAEIAASMVSVFDGQATVKAQGAAVAVESGQGTVVEKGKRPERARPLPLAPEWLDARPALLAVVSGHKATWEAAWREAARAASYRVELATDASFAQVIFDAEIGAGVTRLRLVDLAPGSYAVRVSTRDGDKLESRPGKARLIEVLELTPARALEAGPDGVLEAVGFLRLELEPRARERMFVALDGGAERSGSEPIRLGTAGLHRIALRSERAGAELALRVLAVGARLEVAGEPLGDDAPARITLAVHDERGRPALLPGLVLETSRGDTLALTAIPEGYRAELPPPARGARGPLALRARWMGGELVQRDVAYRAAPEDERARVALLTTAQRVSRRAPGPLVTPQAETRVALDTALRVGAGDLLALALEGELALGRSGLGARLVAEELRLEQGEGADARVQDVSLMARHAFELGASSLAPYLRVALPLGQGHEARTLGLEPGVLWRLRLGSAFVDARAALLLTPGDDSLARGAALVALGLDLGRALTLGLAAQATSDFAAEHRGELGLGASFYLGALRLGAALGVDSAGAALGRLVIDVGVP